MSVDKVLSRSGVAGLLMLVFIPVIWPLTNKLEARLFPVVTHLTALDETPVEEGVSFYVEFEKLRDCEFIGINWYKGPDRLLLDFEPDADKMPQTRPQGDQNAGPWFLRKLEGRLNSLEGTIASTQHRCHPLWITTTHFYP